MLKRLLELAAQVLEITQERTQTARKDAKRAVRDFSHDAATGAEQLSQEFNKRFHAGPRTSTRALQFVIGLGVGFGTALLFSPLNGQQVREKLFNFATRSPREMRVGIDEQAQGEGSDLDA